MSWALADYNVYESICHEKYCDIKTLNRFKKDPRVRVGPEWSDNRFDMWAAFKFGAELQASRKHWLVFHARSRMYAIDAETEAGAERLVRDYTSRVNSR